MLYLAAYPPSAARLPGRKLDFLRSYTRYIPKAFGIGVSRHVISPVSSSLSSVTELFFGQNLRKYIMHSHSFLRIMINRSLLSSILNKK